MRVYENVTVTYDEEAEAWYVYLDPTRPQAHNGSLHPRSVVFDYNGVGEVQGIEII